MTPRPIENLILMYKQNVIDLNQVIDEAKRWDMELDIRNEMIRYLRNDKTTIYKDIEQATGFHKRLLSEIDILREECSEIRDKERISQKRIIDLEKKNKDLEERIKELNECNRFDLMEM